MKNFAGRTGLTVDCPFVTIATKSGTGVFCIDFLTIFYGETGDFGMYFTKFFHFKNCEQSSVNPKMTKISGFRMRNMKFFILHILQPFYLPMEQQY